MARKRAGDRAALVGSALVTATLLNIHRDPKKTPKAVGVDDILGKDTDARQRDWKAEQAAAMQFALEEDARCGVDREQSAARIAETAKEASD